MAPKSNGKLIAGIVAGVVVALVLCGGVAVAGTLFFQRTYVDNIPGAPGRIDGVVDYRATQPGILTRQHVQGDPGYTVKPPVGGNHDATWQNCQGNVYTAPIGDPHAVHSLEHGAVWITYRQGLPQAQVDALADRVEGRDYTMLSPYPGLDRAISLQAWGYQLKVDDADDARIDEFLTRYRVSASIEPGAPCSNGTTATG